MTNTQETSSAGFAAFLDTYHAALIRQSHGEPGPLRDLWSKSDDVRFLSPMGGYQIGYEQVTGLLAVVSSTLSYEEFKADNLLTMVDEHIAVTMEIEHIARKPDPTRDSAWPDELGLRVTTVYRREEDGWRLVARHANPFEELDFPLYTEAKGA